jgi:ubiquinone/menaquinone biosynthesis C-methylase UbiE
MFELKYGDFSGLGNNYSKGRKGQAPEVIKYTDSLLKNSKLILDLGCGTGIPTRQLNSLGKLIIGVDINKDMIREALNFPSRNVSYVIASSTDIPFEDNLFDSITIFGAFHWLIFHDKEKTMKEINRVLKIDGKIIISKFEEKSDFNVEIKTILQKYATQPMISPQDNYFPESVLKEYNFNDISTKKFESHKSYSLEEAIAYVQSMSSWNIVDKGEKQNALSELENLFRKKLEKQDRIYRDSFTTIITGKK